MIVMLGPSGVLCYHARHVVPWQFADEEG